MNNPPSTSSINTVGIDAKHHILGNNYEACTGCAACAAVCPSGAITMQDDHEGFKQPQINPEMCNECDLCRETCPVNKAETDNDKPDHVDGRITPPQVYAAWNLDEEIRRISSSGGVFSALAENILAQGGVVVGAVFDEQLVVRHVLIEKPTELKRLRGSKYVQSEISPSLHHQIKGLLDQGRNVLFSGTPCQVAGLQGYLQKPYENLFCCDLVCHGVPSPLLFKRYLEYISEKGNKLVNVAFRDKTTGWNNFGVRQYFYNDENKLIPLFSDPYMASFLRDYAFRPSCYACKFTRIIRQGDLTIADFWGVRKKYPEYDRDDKGTSLVLINTKKGQTWLNACFQRLFLGRADLDTAIAGNHMLIQSCKRPPQRNTFYNDLFSNAFTAIIKKYQLTRPMYRRALSTIKRILKSIYIYKISGRRKPI